MKQLLDRISQKFEITLPATVSSIEAAENHFNLKLPNDYKEFLRYTNGLEGMTNKRYYIALWSAEELIELNKAYHVEEFVSNIIIIGSDGSEDAFAFNTTNMSIVKLPFIGMGQIAHESISETFEGFLHSQIGNDKSLFRRLFG